MFGTHKRQFIANTLQQTYDSGATAPVRHIYDAPTADQVLHDGYILYAMCFLCLTCNAGIYPS